VINIKQNITHHGDADDTRAVGNAHKSGIRDAANSLPSQKQVN
jgi:hypothetical protein